MNCPDQSGADGVVGQIGQVGEVGVTSLPVPPPVTLPDLPDLADLASLLDVPPMPVLPSLDPTQLLKPITDLLGVFGTGSLGAAPGGDPAVSHRQVAQVLEDGIGTLLRVTQSLDGSWLGQAATSAITAATRTAGESEALAAQGTGLAVDLQAAAAVVAAGALELQGVVAKTAGLLSAALPAIATPPGQVTALAIAAEGLAEGLAVVSATRAQLIAPTAQMTANGAPVAITDTPGTDGFRIAATILESAVPLVQAGAQFATSLLTGAGLDATGLDGNGPGPGQPTASIPPATTPTATTPAGTAPTGTAPTGTGSTSSACPATCEKTTASATAASRTGAAAPTVTAASTVSAPAAVAVDVTASAPSPLADCPTTTNAATVSAGSAPGSVIAPSAAVGADAAMPMAPLAAGVGRAPETTRPIEVVPVTAASDRPVDSEWLTRMTSESADFDVALALGVGHRDLAGSA